MLAIDPQYSGTVYAGTGKGVFKTTDGGVSWSPVNSGLPPFLVEPYTPANSVVIDPLQPATVYVAIGNLSGSRVFKTVNGGESWSAASSGLPEKIEVRFLQIDPQAPGTLYAGTNAGVFKSTDSGANWAAVNSGLRATYILDLAIDPKDSGRLYAASGGLVKTTDRGTTWSPADSGLTAGGSPLAIDAQNTSTIFVSGCDGGGNGVASCAS